MNNRFYICSTSEGCAVNINESSSVANMLEARGYSRCSSSDDASVIIVNTCAVNSKIEDKTVAFLENLEEKYPNKKIVTTGCFPEINPERFKSNFIIPYVSPKKIMNFKDVFDLSKIDHIEMSNTFDLQHSGATYHTVFEKVRSMLKWRIVNALMPKKLNNLIQGIVFNNNFFILPVGTGCLGECTYCAIRYARGSSVSRNIESIMNNLKATDNKNIWLLAGDVGCWGQDIGSDVIKLLSSIFEGGDFNIIVNYFGPEWLEKYYNKLIPYLQDPQLIYIGIPIQSGSNDVLRSANRYYKIENIIRMVKEIKRENRNLVVKTDVIVGLPGESWRDFFQTLYSVWCFDTIYAQGYSQHARTSAKDCENQIPSSVIKMRLVIMKMNIAVKHCATIVSCLNPIRFLS